MVPADSFPEGWPCCDPSFVLETLHELEKEECPQEKKFYSTYAMKWEKLDMEKRQKTLVFFSKLPQLIACDEGFVADNDKLCWKLLLVNYQTFSCRCFPRQGVMCGAGALGAEDVKSQIAVTTCYYNYSKKTFSVPVVRRKHYFVIRWACLDIRNIFLNILSSIESISCNA